MKTKQERRSQETKNTILKAAGKLFAQQGYDAVTMRQIAKEAACSHTAIYVYFKDKEALLHQLSMPLLYELKQSIETAMGHSNHSPEKRLKVVSEEFIHFSLQNKNMYHLLFGVKASRVDERNPTLEINRLRIELFNLLQLAVQDCLQMKQHDPRNLSFARIYFYMLQGIVSTYHYSEESYDTLMTRLKTTIDEALDVVIFGLKNQLEKGDGQ